MSSIDRWISKCISIYYSALKWWSTNRLKTSISLGFLCYYISLGSLLQSVSVGGATLRTLGEVWLAHPAVNLRSPLFAGRTLGRKPEAGGTVWLGKEQSVLPTWRNGQHPSRHLQNTGSVRPAATADKGEQLWAGNDTCMARPDGAEKLAICRVGAWVEALPSGGRLFWNIWVPGGVNIF